MNNLDRSKSINSKPLKMFTVHSSTRGPRPSCAFGRLRAPSGAFGRLRVPVFMKFRYSTPCHNSLMVAEY